MKLHLMSFVPPWLLAMTTILSTGGCTSLSDRYIEKHHIDQLTVVFLDERSLHERYFRIVGRDAVRFVTAMNSTDPSLKTVRGFYDYTTNTLYCEKLNFEVCGHELHHAALGQFHSDD